MVDATRFLGAWLRAGEGIGWLAAGTMPNSLSNAARLSFSDLCILLFLFLSLCRLCVCVFLCSHWSLVDVPLIFFCPADHVPDWQPRVLLGMVEARPVNVKKITATTTLYASTDSNQTIFKVKTEKPKTEKIRGTQGFRACINVLIESVHKICRQNLSKIKLCDWPNKLDATSWQVLKTTESVGMDRF